MASHYSLRPRLTPVTLSTSYRHMIPTGVKGRVWVFLDLNTILLSSQHALNNTRRVKSEAQINKMRVKHKQKGIKWLMKKGLGEKPACFAN